MRNIPSCHIHAWADFGIDIRRLQLTNRRSDQGASAASEGLGRVGAVENSCNHGWRGKVAYVLIRVDIGFKQSVSQKSES